MVSIGEEGYLNATRQILEAATSIKRGIAAIPELYVLGDPLFVVAFGSNEVDIYKVMDAMTERGWRLNGLHRPACLHLCTLRHTQPGFVERLIADLKASVASVKANPSVKGGMAPVYGMANTLPDRSVVADALRQHMDGWYGPS